MSAPLELTVLALSWVAYGLIHSLLASIRIKAVVEKRLPRGFRAYRLVYNLAALVLLIPPLWLMTRYEGAPLWQWPVPLNWLADGLAVAALIGFAASLRLYDTGEFLGIRQLRNYAIDDHAPLRISWAHRYVRHPWYFLGLVVIWTREMNAAWLVSALVVTAYLLLGSRLEERKLIQRFGETYRSYRRRVPGLLPWPGRYLKPREAEALTGTAAGKGVSDVH